MMEKEVMLMKRANINHVRNSHYPDDPYWYFLCNKYEMCIRDSFIAVFAENNRVICRDGKRDFRILVRLPWKFFYMLC